MIQRKLSLKYLYAAFVARARINNGLPTTFYDSPAKSETKHPSEKDLYAMKSARVIIEVVAGLVPGTPIPEYTKRWAITSEDWNAEDADQATLLVTRNGEALGYAAYLMAQPDRLNWVKTDWIWL